MIRDGFVSAHRSILAAATAAACAACAGDARGGPAAEITDSAGVRVVVNAAPGAATVAEWVIAEEPEVEVGVLEGAPEYQLFRVSGARVLSDGTLVIANRGSHELRFFDAGGVHLRSAGGRGDGPGEFEALQLVGAFEGDSLLTFDVQQRRASVFGGDGSFARSFRIAEGTDLRFPSLVGILSNHDVVVRQGSVFTAGEVTTGADRPTERLYLGGPEGEIVDSLGAFPGSEAFVLAEGGGMSVRTLTFGRGLSVAALGDRVAVANNDAYSVRVYDPTGALLHVVRQVREPVTIAPEDYTQVMEAELGEIEDENGRRRARGMFEAMPTRETFPAFSAVRLDATGRLWVEEYRRPGDEQPVWQVFDREGLLIARVRTPVGLRILELGEDYLLGVVQDDLDVERVRLYRWEGDD